VAVRFELGALEAQAGRVAAKRSDLDGAGTRAAQCLAAQQSAQVALVAARTRHAQLVAHHQQSAGTEARRRQLQGECGAAARAGAQAIEALKAQGEGEQQRLERLQRRIAERVRQALHRRQALDERRRRCFAILADEVVARRAVNRLPLAEQVLNARTS